MNRDIEFKGFKPPPWVRNLIAHLVTRVERKAGNFSSDLVSLRVMVEENAAHKLSQVSMILGVLGKTLATKDESHEVVASIKEAFAEIKRQLQKYKSITRQESEWKKPAKRAI
jgi:ribosome-associated translation inhibitor RaiA